MVNDFKYSDDIKRYHTWNYYLRKKFGCKVFKVSLNAGFTCPNIDGTKGVGGCTYCSSSGSGDFAGNPEENIIAQFEEVKTRLHQKWKEAKYIAYFQAHTNTYADVLTLKKYFEPVLGQENVVGISIATRPDAISNECLEYLIELNKKTHLTIELGLQTSNVNTAKLINRCHTLECFEKMVKTLRKNNINVVVHIINGLPYETKLDMLNTVKYLNKLDIQGIKIHMLHILKNTPLEDFYNNTKFKLLEKEEYVDIVVSQLELLDEKIVIHRLTGDGALNDLIGPLWTIKKVCVLNDIDKLMKKNNTYQGIKKDTY